jgi:hypothetical protein
MSPQDEVDDGEKIATRLSNARYPGRELGLLSSTEGRMSGHLKRRWASKEEEEEEKGRRKVSDVRVSIAL